MSGHGFSEDGVTWHFNSAQQPYNGVITFENGTLQHFSTYERPHLVFNEKQQPTHLINGVSPYWQPPGAQGPCDKCDARYVLMSVSMVLPQRVLSHTHVLCDVLEYYLYDVLTVACFIFLNGHLSTTMFI